MFATGQSIQSYTKVVRQVVIKEENDERNSVAWSGLCGNLPHQSEQRTIHYSQPLFSTILYHPPPAPAMFRCLSPCFIAFCCFKPSPTAPRHLLPTPFLLYRSLLEYVSDRKLVVLLNNGHHGNSRRRRMARILLSRPVIFKLPAK